MVATGVRVSTLNGRERVERPLNHLEPDRIPLSLTIIQVPYMRLKEHLGPPPDNEMRAHVFGEVWPKPDLLDALGVDVNWISLHKPDKNISKPASQDGIVYDEWEVGRRRIDLNSGTFYCDVVEAPLKDVRQSAGPPVSIETVFRQSFACGKYRLLEREPIQALCFG